MAQEKRRLALDPDATRYAGLAVRYPADLLTQDARDGAKYIFRIGEPNASNEKDVAIFCRCHILGPSLPCVQPVHFPLLRSVECGAPRSRTLGLSRCRKPERRRSGATVLVVKGPGIFF